MDDWNRFAPIALAAEKPVAQFILNGFFSNPLLLQPMRDLFFGLRSRNSVQRQTAVRGTRVFARALTRKCFTCFQRHALRCSHYFNHRQSVPKRKLMIAFIVRRHRHNGSGAVTDQDIVRDPDWNFLLIHRVNSIRSGKYPALVFGQIGAFQI